MAWRSGDEVIVTSEGVHRVGVVLDRRILNKSSVYDVLLENRTALVMLNTAHSAHNYINRALTTRLIDSGMIKSTIPYKELVAAEALPYLNASVGTSGLNSF